MKEKNILIRSFIRNPDKTRATRNRMKVFQTGAVWFALSLSFSALTAGTAAAPLGASAGAAALIIGQLTGGFLLYLAGRNGEKNGKKSMESSALSFGQAGSSFFAVLNLIQLTGWSAFLIRESSDLISEMIPGMSDSVLPAAAEHIFRIVLTGGLILLLLAGAANKLSLICIPAALIMIVLLILLCLQITENSGSFSFSGYRAAFGDVVALSASLPLFWIPVIADYTSSFSGKKDTVPVPGSVSSRAAAVAASAFTAGGCAAGLIGMFAALRFPDIPVIFASSGFTAAGVLLILIPAVLSALFCLQAAGVNSVFICDKIDAKKSSVAAGIFSVLLAAAVPAGQLAPFLRFIAAAFLPMTAIVTADIFPAGCRRKKDADSQAAEKIRISNVILWIFGFFLFQFFIRHTTPLGSALPAFLLIYAACGAVRYLLRHSGELVRAWRLKFLRLALRPAAEADGDTNTNTNTNMNINVNANSNASINSDTDANAAGSAAEKTAAVPDAADPGNGDRKAQAVSLSAEKTDDTEDPAENKETGH